MTVPIYHAIGGSLVRTGRAAVAAPLSYGPVSVADINEFASKGYGTVPTDANFVTWHWPTGYDLWDACNTLGANDILVLPEDATPYQITNFHASANPVGANATRGIIGLGPNAVIGFSSSFPTLAAGTGSAEECMVESWTSNARFANFTMRGKNIGGRAYSGLSIRQTTGVTVERIATVGHYGFAAAPPGESFGISCWRADNLTINRCEVDGRDPVTHVVQGSGGIHLQRGSTITVNDCYLHHVRGHGVANWARAGATTLNRLVIESIGLSSYVGAGINLEGCGTFAYTVNETTFNMKRSTTGNPYAFVADVSVGSSPGTSGASYSIGRTPVTLNNCTFDEASVPIFCGTGSSAAAYDGLANISVSSDFTFSPSKAATYSNFNY